MCGLPSSGKTRVANKLMNYFQTTKQQQASSQDRKVVYVSDSSFFHKDEKNAIYADPTKEKELRGALKSEVQKFMSKDDLLILDSLNYIKGYRYELYCISKLYQTPQCVIYTERSIDECSKFNEQRDANQKYTAEK